MQGTILAAIADLLALRLKAQTEISSMAKPLQAQPSLAATDSSPRFKIEGWRIDDDLLDIGSHAGSNHNEVLIRISQGWRTSWR
jgi:hypothetical protein